MEEITFFQWNWLIYDTGRFVSDYHLRLVHLKTGHFDEKIFKAIHE